MDVEDLQPNNRTPSVRMNYCDGTFLTHPKVLIGMEISGEIVKMGRIVASAFAISSTGILLGAVLQTPFIIAGGRGWARSADGFTPGFIESPRHNRTSELDFKWHLADGIFGFLFGMSAWVLLTVASIFFVAAGPIFGVEIPQEQVLYHASGFAVLLTISATSTGLNDSSRREISEFFSDTRTRM
jgi:hypothetical protein